MPSLSYILVERLDSFGSFEDLQSVLHHIKALGYGGVELNLTPNVSFEMEALARFAESIQLPVVSFLTGANYFSEGLCLSSLKLGCETAPYAVSKSVRLLRHGSALFWWLAKCRAS